MILLQNRVVALFRDYQATSLVASYLQAAKPRASSSIAIHVSPTSVCAATDRLATLEAFSTTRHAPPCERPETNRKNP